MATQTMRQATEAASQGKAVPRVNPALSSTDAGGGGGGGSSFYGPYDEVLSGYRNFANTGGFSPQDIAAIRSRSLSPIRAVYANAFREVGRQRALQGGYSPNYTAAMAKMAREQSYATADATTNTEAGLAEMTTKNKLAGLGGMAGLVGREGGGGGGGGGEVQPANTGGFWSKFGRGLKAIGKVALPIALNYFTGGMSGAAKGAKGILTPGGTNPAQPGGNMAGMR